MEVKIHICQGKSDYNSPFDYIHPEYGIPEIKHSSLYIKRGIWYFNIGDEHNFDFLIAVCMDENRSWKDIKRVYKIPRKDVSTKKVLLLQNVSQNTKNLE